MCVCVCFALFCVSQSVWESGGGFSYVGRQHTNKKKQQQQRNPTAPDPVILSVSAPRASTGPCALGWPKVPKPYRITLIFLTRLFGRFPTGVGETQGCFGAPACHHTTRPSASFPTFGNWLAGALQLEKRSRLQRNAQCISALFR